ncbi:hypothetical protein GCM10010216_54890 [Streptomyces flaveolus]|nr:hypothetical protein GCM10010216_54890 [Streptomyces flaveolus]
MRQHYRAALGVARDRDMVPALDIHCITLSVRAPCSRAGPIGGGAGGIALGAAEGARSPSECSRVPEGNYDVDHQGYEDRENDRCED